MPQPKSPGNRPRRFRPAAAVLAGLAAALGIGLLVYQGRHSGVSTLPESPRTDLVLHDGRLYLPESPVPFTGHVTDAYEGGVLKSRSVVSNGVLHGHSTGWHTNGQQQVEEHFLEGISHGLRTKWYPSGRKLSEVNIVDGKLDGTFRRWHENGQLAEEVKLKDGQPDGLSRSWFESGFLKARVTLSSGTVVEQEFLKDGEVRETASNDSDLAHRD